MTTGPAAALLAEVAQFGALAYQWDVMNDRVLLLRLSAAEAKAASFLDQRMLTQSAIGAWTAWSDFERAASALPDRSPPMIFHVGHCGSTLYSKLVEAATGAEGMREPLLLRGLAFEYEDASSGNSLFDETALIARLRVFLRSCARGGGASVVKASSMCGGLMSPLFASNPDARGVFAYIRPETYIATMLGGENNRTDLKGFAKFRRQRVVRRGAAFAPLSSLSPGELAALCWLAEATSCAEAAKQAGERILPVDFDTFLKSPLEGLTALCRHLGAAAKQSAIEAAVSGKTMASYSKAQEFAFDANDRAALIAQYSTNYQAEIAKGMDLLSRTAKGNALAADALNRLA